MVGISLVLVFFLNLSGVALIEDKGECNTNPSLLGEYIEGSDVIILCNKNIRHTSYDPNTILRHEIVHKVHENFGMEKSTFIKEPLLTELVRFSLKNEEAMAILLNYSGYVSQEFEARILQNLPDIIVGPFLWLSSLNKNR